MQTGANVKLLAGDQVVLRRGFIAKGDFEARTEPCNNVIIKSAEADNEEFDINENVEKTGIINPSEFSVFPNPTNGEVSMCYTLENDSFVQLEIYNELGILIKTELSLSEQKAGNYYYNFYIDNLSPATYILYLKTNNKNYSTKIIKK